MNDTGVFKSYCLKVVVLCSALFASVCAQAASVYITPASSNVTNGSTIDLMVSGSGFPTTTFGGSLSVSWDPTVLDYTSYSVDSLWDEFSSDTTGVASGAFGNLQFALPPATAQSGSSFDVMTLSFNVIGNPGDMTMVSAITGSTDDWVDDLTGLVISPVDYTAAQVTVVPIPAAAYLLVTGFIGLVGMGRRRKK